MVKIKMFTQNETIEEFEDKINKWIEENKISLKDIKFRIGDYGLAVILIYEIFCCVCGEKLNKCYMLGGNPYCEKCNEIEKISFNEFTTIKKSDEFMSNTENKSEDKRTRKGFCKKCKKETLFEFIDNLSNTNSFNILEKWKCSECGNIQIHKND